MKIAPLIHSRTLHCDFNPNFAVRPDDLDVDWAMKKVLQSTSDIDILNGVRWLTASNGQTVIVGIACNLKFFIERYVPEAAAEAEKYFHDERGREIKVFLGYVFKGDGVPNVSCKDLWQMFEENMSKVWEFKVAETVSVPYRDCGTKSVSDKVKPVETIDGVDFYISGEDSDEKILTQCIAEHKNFCSNADQFKIIASREFNVISTSRGNIERFKAEPEKKTPPPVQTAAPPTNTTTSTSRSPAIRNSKESSSKKRPVIVAGIIVVILIILKFLLT